MLREVLRKVQAGEDVDVEKMLGTGDPLAEQEWEEGTSSHNSNSISTLLSWKELISRFVVIKHIEEEERLWQSKEKKKARKQARREAREAAQAEIAAENAPKASDLFSKTTKSFAEDGELPPKRKRTPGFY